MFSAPGAISVVKTSLVKESGNSEAFERGDDGGVRVDEGDVVGLLTGSRCGVVAVIERFRAGVDAEAVG